MPELVPAVPEADPRAPWAQTSRGARVSAATSWSRRLLDRSGRLVVTIGGMTIIASILGILVFILAEVAPLLSGARVELGPTAAGPASDALAALGDERRQQAAVLAADGRVYVVRLDAQASPRLLAPSMAAAAAGGALPLVHPRAVDGEPAFVAGTRDGRLLVVGLRWETAFGDSGAAAEPALGRQTLFELDPAGGPLEVFAAAFDEGGATTAAARCADGQLALIRQTLAQNPITGESDESVQRSRFAAPHLVTSLAVDGGGRHLFGGTAAGELVHWPLIDGAPGAPVVVSAGSAAITALSFLIGHRTLVVGQADGSLSIWLLVRQADQKLRPTRVRDLPALPGAIRLIAPSPRHKGFLAQDAGGRMGLYASTSARTLWLGASPLADASALVFSPKADGALIAASGRLAALAIHNPHPEVSLSALFGRVWYEGADGPRFVWQSSGASDDIEPKLSLVPLLVGTLKGTLYSLILAIPLGVLGAMYTSQFMHHSLRRFVKPTVEIMAALPSVVLGFLAGLWLAPRVEQVFPALLLLALVLPAAALAAGFSYQLLPLRVRGRWPSGVEALVAVGFLALGAGLCLAAEPSVERLAFGGRFPSWVQSVLGLTYDQRNAVVVGLAMGFAVIPIIFAIAEDAFTNVPRGLVAGSLALGASRWQTVTRVVLPTASPGVFSAIMIGFGRAVGETMIVLMATGNTPIMDWSPFNGFRTLSANIAVEIPEAPHGGTLYRTLFLAGLLLFALTFLVNTAAELVRQRLRRRFANL